MKICADYNGGVLYLRLLGEMDEHGATTARRDADRLVDDFAPRTNRAVIDLGGVSFMDSSGIGLILGRAELCRTIGARVSVTGLDPHLSKLISLSGVDRVKNVSVLTASVR